MNLAKLSKVMEAKLNEPAQDDDQLDPNNLPPAMEALRQVMEQAMGGGNNSSSVRAQPSPQPTAPAVNPWAKIHTQRDKLCASIKTERGMQGLTQRQLASKANMSQGTITRAERHGDISFTCLLRIADALGKEITLN